MMPTGFRFNPTDEELIEILERKVSGQEMPVHDTFIVERNVYELDPQDLEWDPTVVLSDNERYCYYIRATDSREVMGRGWWRATGHVKKIYADNDNIEHVVGYKRPLTFVKFTDNERNRKNAFKTNWIMHEYNLDSNTTEWRLCKIMYKGKSSVKEEVDHNTKNDYTLRSTDFEVSCNSSIIMVMQPNFIGEEEQEQPELDNFYEYDPHSEAISSSIMVMQPQFLKIDNLYETFSEVSSSMDMQLLQQLPQILQLDDEVNGSYNFKENMQMEVMDDHQQQQQQSNASYDPILTHITTSNYFFDVSDELFPSLWSY
ncbi:NAC domain-containing protein 83-like [Pistacia vera]|uniref:NAC domain-containing protein 83-like n=1 Tax=Pistacia vera TaxID=55513 RepID=UPI001262D542|nr:NAC domain-containing protein 83-like [Pistacia vera]